jgi:cell division inhibitor SulA
MPNWLTIIFGIAGAVGTAVTAVATIFLWRVTKTLAIETKRMAETSSQPQIVATLEPNQWSMMHADLVIANTGNATAFDIRLTFDPPLQNGEAREGQPGIPFQKVSLLKPGHSASSYLSEFGPLLGNNYTVTITWLRDPGKTERETSSYALDMRDTDGITRLGAASPLIQIAEQIKKMREDWKSVAGGTRKVSVDLFSSGDRLHARRANDRYRRRQRREQEALAAKQAAAQPTPDKNSPANDGQ